MLDNSISAALGERYTPVRLLATGGMGEVWLATDQVLGRDVACKVLKAELAQDPGFRERFVNEARSAAQLQHPGVAGVFDFGEKPGERPFLVMELVDGPVLTDLLRRGPLSPERARDVVVQVADALGAAHDIGLVHRDVKPGNILLCEDGRVKLTDFGIARAGDGVALTKTGEIVGTPSYLSPEQAEGRSATSASDVYALGCVLYECLTGEKPYAADGPVATALAHLRQPVPELPQDVPQDLADVTRRAMAKDPAERYPDGAALAKALRGESTLTLAIPTEAAEGPITLRRRHWPVVAMLALAVLLLATLVVNGLGGSTGHEPPVTHDRTAASHQVDVVPGAYVGKRLDVVRAALTALGLKVKVVPKANPGGHAAGTVADLRPTGRVDRGTTITLSVWGAPPAPAPTTKAPTSGTSTQHHDKHGHGKGKGKG